MGQYQFAMVLMAEGMHIQPAEHQLLVLPRPTILTPAPWQRLLLKLDYQLPQ